MYVSVLLRCMFANDSISGTINLVLGTKPIFSFAGLKQRKKANNSATHEVKLACLCVCVREKERVEVEAKRRKDPRIRNMA